MSVKGCNNNVVCTNKFIQGVDVMNENAIYKRILETRKFDDPIWKKDILNLYEAVAYFGLGPQKIRQIIKQKNCSFVIYKGNKPFIFRKQMENYLKNKSKI